MVSIDRDENIENDSRGNRDKLAGLLGCLTVAQLKAKQKIDEHPKQFDTDDEAAEWLKSMVSEVEQTNGFMRPDFKHQNQPISRFTIKVGGEDVVFVLDGYMPTGDDSPNYNGERRYYLGVRPSKGPNFNKWFGLMFPNLGQ